MPNAPTGTIVGFDYATEEKLFEVENRVTAVAGKSTLPFPGQVYVHDDGRRYRVKKILADATDKLWKISVSDEGSN